MYKYADCNPYLWRTLPRAAGRIQMNVLQHLQDYVRFVLVGRRLGLPSGRCRRRLFLSGGCRRLDLPGGCRRLLRDVTGRTSAAIRLPS